MSSVENSFAQHFSDLEVEIYYQDFRARKKESLSDRFERLQNELGLEGKESTTLSKIAFLQKGIKDMKVLMDEFEGITTKK
eukprot:6171565-Ditylum_brightwellii.AAC.1